MTTQDLPMTGYDTEDRYFASRYTQGGRTVYSIDLSLAAVAATLPRPDPLKPTQGNRRVDESHARNFGKYVRENPDWVAPALLLRAPDIFQFNVKEQVAGTQFGILGLPRLARTDLRILDGQHRILGLNYAVEDIAAELERWRTLVATAKRDGNLELERHNQQQVKKLEQQRERLHKERISIQIHIDDDQKRSMQMFTDIADNAKGISSALRVRFDSRKVVNRALELVLRHSLLVNRVDLEQDRIGGENPNWLGAKHVADITRTLAVGLGGRVGRRQEDELNESALAETSLAFFDTLVEGFDLLEAVEKGAKTPQELRRGSLLGSTTMIRVLSAVYKELARDQSDEDIAEFWSRLALHMDAPVGEKSIWVTQVPSDVFSQGAFAPKARGGDMSVLKEQIVKWAKAQPEPSWLKPKQRTRA